MATALGSDPFLAALLERCHLPPAGSVVTCALSGGPDSSALVALAVAGGCRVTAVHVNHGLRPSADVDEATAVSTAELLGVDVRLERADLADGPNLEARAREARRRLLGDGVLTGHTADDQAETVLLALLRGAGATGLAAMTPGPTKPLLALRRRETHEVCARLELPVALDPTNDDPRFRRNRVRHELLPVLEAIAERDVVPLLTRTADLVRDDDTFLDQLARELDPTDARQLGAAPAPLARRAVRRWLLLAGYPPDAAAVERVLDVAAGRSRACELTGGRRVERRRQRLVLTSAGESANG